MRLRSLIPALVLAMYGGFATAQEFDGQPVPVASGHPMSTWWYGGVPTYPGPSPFAVSGSDLGLSGFGYYHDEPTEHRLGPTPGDRSVRRTGSLPRPAPISDQRPRTVGPYGPGEWVSLKR